MSSINKAFEGSLEDCSNFCWDNYRVESYAPIYTTNGQVWDDENDRWVGGNGQNSVHPFYVRQVERAVYGLAFIWKSGQIWQVDFKSQDIVGLRCATKAVITFPVCPKIATKLGLPAYMGWYDGEQRPRLQDILAEWSGQVEYSVNA